MSAHFTVLPRRKNVSRAGVAYQNKVLLSNLIPVHGTAITTPPYAPELDARGQDESGTTVHVDVCVDVSRRAPQLDDTIEFSFEMFTRSLRVS